MVHPLQKRTARGKVYQRTAAVEAAIAIVTAQPLSVISARSTIRDPKLSDYLPSQCLVYLIRQAIRQNDAPRSMELLKMLLIRCEINLKRHVAEDAFPDAEALRTEILSDFADLFTEEWARPDSTRLDFFEVHFNSAFANFRIDRIRTERTRTSQQASPPVRQKSGSVRTEDEILSALAASDGLEKCSPLQLDFREELLDAISELPPEEREAITLCYLSGYEIESADPTKPTAATIIGVTGRTIRNRLAKGIKTIQQRMK